MNERKGPSEDEVKDISPEEKLEALKKQNLALIKSGADDPQSEFHDSFLRINRQISELEKQKFQEGKKED